MKIVLFHQNIKALGLLFTEPQNNTVLVFSFVLFCVLSFEVKLVPWNHKFYWVVVKYIFSVALTWPLHSDLHWIYKISGSQGRQDEYY